MGHLARDLGVVRLPGVPEPVAAGEGDVEKQAEEDHEQRHLALAQSGPDTVTGSLGEHLLELEKLEIDRLAGSDHLGERRRAHLSANEPHQAAVLAAIQTFGRRRRQPRRQQAIERPRLAAALHVAERGDPQVESQPPLLALEVLRQLDGVVACAPSATTTIACGLPRSQAACRFWAMSSGSTSASGMTTESAPPAMPAISAR